jgi:aspartyl-tRNA(Asn)/glutamyl-tRNA(Gln) amidotransferase subunit A
MLENYIAPYNAHVIDKLLEQDAVILGKTNLDEFAMGSSTETSYFGVTRNPHDLERVPGGSSGGSAAAVAADMCVFALGSDTGGSIRQPASFCGVVGLKPTYGRVSRNGVMAFASSLDQIGPFTKTTEDAKIVMDVLKGVDEKDSTTCEVDDSKPICDKKNFKIGIPKQYFGEGLDEDVKKTIEASLEELKKQGVELVEIDLPHAKYALNCYYVIAPAEASANLARFDGVRYGFQTDDAQNLEDVYVKSKTEGFGKEVKKRIMLGTYVLSSGYYDAYYKSALKVRSLIKKDFDEAFRKVDAVVGPTSPILPFKIGEKMDDPLSMYLADVYTVSVNLVGLPGVSVPCGKVNNLPVGLQIICPAFEEYKMLNIANLIHNV